MGGAMPRGAASPKTRHLLVLECLKALPGWASLYDIVAKSRELTVRAPTTVGTQALLRELGKMGLVEQAWVGEYRERHLVYQLVPEVQQPMGNVPPEAVEVHEGH